MGWNESTKMGFKTFHGLRGFVSDMYNPLRKNISSIHKGAHWFDNLLQSSSKYGVPNSLIDMFRGNPIYSEIMTTVDVADDLVDKDIPNLVSAVGKEFNQLGARTYQMPASMRARNMVNGMTPNRGPTSRQMMGAGMAVS